jgi:uncharacterized protein YjbI with pentapeptide repeats
MAKSRQELRKAVSEMLTIITRDENELLALREIIEAHELWLRSDGIEGERAYLRGANFRKLGIECDLRKADLRGADFEKAELHNCDFSGADLRGAIFDETEMRGVKMCGADLRGAYLFGADLRRADLSEADLRGADFECAQIELTDFWQAKIEGADFNWTQVPRALNLHVEYEPIPIPIRTEEDK